MGHGSGAEKSPWDYNKECFMKKRMVFAAMLGMALTLAFPWNAEAEDAEPQPDPAPDIEQEFSELKIIASLNGTAPAPGIKQDFSEGRRVVAGVLNLALGVGSFTMGDWKAGLILLGGYTAAGALIGVELGVLEHDDVLAGVLGPIGAGVAGLTVIYGFIRPFLYHKSTRTTLIDVLDRVHIAVIPDDTAGIQAVGLSYTYHY
jgi:hypothetical protein